MKLNTKIALLFLYTLFLQNSTVFCQVSKIVIRGKVISKLDKSPLIGVNIVELDINNRIVNATITDFDGNYSLKVTGAKENNIVYTYIGYKKIVRKYQNSNIINVEMDDAAAQINEVTVSARRKASTGLVPIDERDLTFAMSKIETKDLDGLQVASIDEALQGRMSGVDIVSNSGEPGAGMSIRIRGTTSINNGSDPLIVVDGIPYDTSVGADFDFATADQENYAQLLNISPSDIQEISVLKDAAACAMYGNRGANGVLVIKTKRGVMSKPMVNYSFKGSINTPAKPVKLLNGNQYTSLIFDQAQNAGTALNTVTYPQFSYDPQNPYYFYNYGQNTDWYSAITRNGNTQDHNLSLSGGGEKVMYRTSIGYFDQKGTILGQSYTRLTSSLNLDYNVSDRLRFQVNLAYTNGVKYTNYTSDLVKSAFAKMPNMSIYEYLPDANGRYSITPNYFSPAVTPQGSFLTFDYDKYTGGVYNPVAMATNGFSKITNKRILPKFNLQYWIIADVLKYQADIAFDINITKDNKFLPQIATGRAWPELSVNRASDITTGAFTVQTFNKLYYTPLLGKDHDIIGMLQFSTYDALTSSYQEVSALSASTILRDPSIPASIFGTGLGLNSKSPQSRTMSLLAMLQYKYLDRYVINATVRRDGDSKYSEQERFGYFPSLSVRWRASSEEFLKNLKFIDDLSLKASTGSSGNPVEKNYLYFNNYATYEWSYLGEQAVFSKNLQLTNLMWEKVSDFNLGANMNLFDNRLNFEFNWYKKRTTNLYFANVAISSATGYSNVNGNVGTMDNRGWELSVFSQPVKTKEWQLDFNVSLARSENEIIQLSDNIPLVSTPTASNGKYLTKLQVGNPLGSFYGYVYDGVYLNEEQTIAQDESGNPIYAKDSKGNKIPVKMKFWYPSVSYDFQPGDAKYEDINHDGNINSEDIVYLGNFNPTLTGGFGPTLRYKNSLSLSAYFYFRLGFDIINQTRMDLESMYDFDNQSTAVLRRWTESYDDISQAPSSILPRALHGKGYNWLGSSRFVEDGSFLRFKSLTMSFNFDKKKIKKIGLTDIKLWATLQNIYLWTNYKGMDPEVSVGSGLTSLGYDKSHSGRPAEYSMGLSISF